ncbi:MAG: hypothetical protein CM15mP111_0640 [Hyphomicrobiales bacterium]|nr:MAG: hypothetical protein CM15mP111_0640 [Hyphomicrobiales bacterium]
MAHNLVAKDLLDLYAGLVAYLIGQVSSSTMIKEFMVFSLL